MKKLGIYISLFCLLAFTACKSYTPSMSVPEYDPIQKPFEELDVNVNISDGSYVMEKEVAIINKTIRKDLVTNYIKRTSSVSMGKIIVEGKVKYEGSAIGLMYCWVPLSPLILLGTPTDIPGADINLQFSIYDCNGNLVNTYLYHYFEKRASGIYYGKSSKRLVLDGAKEIMKEFRRDVSKDNEINTTRLSHPLTEQQTEQLTPAIANIYWPLSKKAKYNTNSKYIVRINNKEICTIKKGDILKIQLPHGKSIIETKEAYGSVWTKDSIIVASGKEFFYEISVWDHLLLSHKQEMEKIRQNGFLPNEFAYDASFTKPQSSLLIANTKKTKEEELLRESIPSSREKVTNQSVQSRYNLHSTKSLVDTNIPQAKVNSENTYVLIISNEQYDQLDNVSYAAHDGEIFKEYCQKTLGIPDKQIFFYQNATYGRIVDGVEKLKYCLNNFENSKAIVYYCGHGIPDEKTGQAYLIPVDGKGTNMTTCYSLKNLYKTLAATKAQSITYFMDACFTGANKEGSMLVAARGVAREPVKEILAGKTVVFSASSGDETAMTLEEQGHGLFTYYLLKKLQETEGNVTYGELADYINKNVKKDAFLINEKPQTPVVATSPAVVNTWKSMKLK